MIGYQPDPNWQTAYLLRNDIQSGFGFGVVSNGNDLYHTNPAIDFNGESLLWLSVPGREPTHNQLVQRMVPIPLKVAPFTVLFGDATTTVYENTGLARIPVYHSVPVPHAVTVNYTLINGTALLGSDYNTVNGTLTFEPYDMVKYIDIPLVIDQQLENDETFTIQLSNPQQTSLGTPNQLTVTISDDPFNGVGILNLTLINADTDQPIAAYNPLVDGATLNFATLGTNRLSIVANTLPETIGSVDFILDGVSYRVESSPPYAIAGNTGTNYYSWTPSLGTHTLKVIPYTAPNAPGLAGVPYIINFTVTNGSVATNTPTRTPTPTLTTNTPTATPSGAKTALFVVSNASSLNAGDTAVKTRLEGLGYVVTLKTASASASSDATSKTLVLISSSVASTDVNTKFKSVTVPVIVWEYALYDDMAMTNTASGTDYGYNTGTSMVITNASHPLAAGLSGTVSLYSTTTNIPYGATGANAINVGAVSSTSSRKLLFAYDKNAAMIGGFTVNARRVGLFLVDTATPTANAWTLFDAAVTWATSP